MNLKYGIAMLAAGSLAYAQSPATVRVSSETVPPGGMVQAKVLLTSPQPIPGGGSHFSGALSEADGIALFSSTGDVFGTAVQNGGNVSVQFVSPKGTFGTGVEDYPVMTVTFAVPATALPGQKSTMALDPSTVWQTALGTPLSVELQPGTLTIGGSVSIANVVPGGGQWPAGTVVRILGMGFSPKTQVQLKAAQASSIVYVSPTEMHMTLKNAQSMDGVEISVKNPDGTSDSYFSYLRGVPVGVSANPLIASTVPIFSTNTTTSATLGPLILPQIASPYVVGLALQNPGAVTANIALTLQGARPVTIALQPGHKISRELGEWFGIPIPSGASVKVTSDVPVQALGMLGNKTTGSVLPVGLLFQ